jgi:hypothetical protein
MRRIYDFYRNPPQVGQTICYCSLDDDETDWAWFALEDEPVPDSAHPDMTCPYDGAHAREMAEARANPMPLTYDD